jgi:predicted O-methyltransferase YrrM
LTNAPAQEAVLRQLDGFLDSDTVSPIKPLPQVEEVLDSLFSAADRQFLRSAISRQEGAFLCALASRPDVKATIEVGCANGISGLYICSGIFHKANPGHTAIDPFQSSEFQGRGVANIRRAGFDFFRLIEEPSETALPALVSCGARYDMALIDGLHTADQAMVDFYFLDRLLRVGGILVFDDVQSSAVNKVVRYTATYPNYKLIGTCARRGIQRRMINLLKQILSLGLWPVRKASETLCREFFDISLIHPEVLWSIDFCTMAAFEKTAEYQRDTEWYRGI